MHTQEEAALLSRAAEGDADALRALLAAHGGQVWALVHADIGSRYRSLIDADDVMQVTYMEAFLHASQMTARDAAGFVAWLRRIARNNLRDAIKELDRKKRPAPGLRIGAGGEDDSYVALVEMLSTTSSTPSRQLAQREAVEAVEHVLQRLPPDYARVVRLYDLEGRPIGDVAASVGRSRGAVHMLRSRAHDRLRELLGSEPDFFTHTA